MKTVVSETYRVSERVELARGDTFRASGGPYWKGPNGEKVAVKAKGPYTFHSHTKRGSCEWINALDRDGQYAVLHIAGRRKSLAGLVPRPYVILGKKRKKKGLSECSTLTRRSSSTSSASTTDSQSGRKRGSKRPSRKA